MSAIPAAGYLVEFGARGSHPGGTAAETAARIDEAYARGVAEGKAAARGECEAEIKRRSEEMAQQLVGERAAWAAETGEKLAMQIAAAARGVEESVANSLAVVLKPFLIAELHGQALDELARIVRGLMTKDPGVSMEIVGPQDLLKTLQAKLGPDATNIRFSAGAGCDVRVTADQTVVETRLGAWVAKIEEALG